jgi:hypothetical protein
MLKILGQYQLQREECLQKTEQELRERVKELNCLYAISNLLHAPNSTLTEAIPKILQIIPCAWQYPQITGVRITIAEHEFTTLNFKPTSWLLVSDITAQSGKIGTIEVVYLEAKPPIDHGPFMAEEKTLLNTIADLLGQFLQQLRNEKPKWQVILDLLMQTDAQALLRMTRKMMYYLSRNQKVNFEKLMQTLCPSDDDPGHAEWLGINMPNPRKSMEALKRVQEDVFEIARRSLPPDEIAKLLYLWLDQDKARPLLLASEKRGVPLTEITDALNHFHDLPQAERILSPEDDVSIRTNLIRRFFIDSLPFLKVAKDFITVEDFVDLVKKIVGPAHGAGQMGGKASGVYLAEKIVKKAMAKDKDLANVSFARSWYITSDTLWEVIHYNALDEVAHVKYMESEAIRQEQPFWVQVFKNAAFPAEIITSLRRVLTEVADKPIIVRSSSILEDSFIAAFPGKYKSLFLANRGTENEKLSALTDAIGEVYASTLGPDPIEYRRERGLLDFDEGMGILIQEVVGIQIGPYYMPAFAGVAFSHNEFRWSPRISREDGVIRLVAGLGTRAVDRIGNDYPVLVSLNNPELKVNIQPLEAARYSQHYIDVINLEHGIPETIKVAELLQKYNEQFPKLNQVVSIYKDGSLTAPTGIILDADHADFIVTFAGLIKSIFIRQMRRIVTLIKDTLGTPVDIEFASDGEHLYIVQCRPQVQANNAAKVQVPEDIAAERKIFSANKYVTAGYLEQIEYIVYVDAEAYDALEQRDDIINVARAVGHLNSLLPKRKFILMGPGRWGSRGDIKLGVPVQYRDINNTVLLVEVAKKKGGGYMPELSFGTHFFQDLVEANIQYLPLYPDEQGIVFNEKFLQQSPNVLGRICPQYKYIENVVRLLCIPEITHGGKLSVVMDGEAGKALAFVTGG